MARALTVALVLTFAFAAPASAAPELSKLGDFNQPTYATSAPDDGGRVYVTEKPGVVRIAGQDAPFLDLTADTLSTDTERGLLSIAFAPDYATSGRFYVYLTAQPAGELQIREYRRSAGNPYVADPSTGRTLVAIPHAEAPNHNGGQLQFGPDGKLYAGTGDGGGGNDQFHHSQDPGSLLGKLLTIDTAQGGATVVSRGLRNPWRFSFDRATGQLVIGDVGEGQIEEIDVGLAGNYGWPCKEGTRDNPSAFGCPGPPSAAPFLEQTHANGFCSVVGGYVVRDPGLPTLNGRYLYGDYCNAPLRSVDLSNAASDAPVGLSVGGLSSFGQDACGRILAVSLNGPVYRMTDGALSACPRSAASPPGGAADTAACKLSARVTGLNSVRRRHRLTVALRANEACSATASARVRGVASFKSTTRRLSASRRATLTLRLTARGQRAVRRALRRHRTLRVELRVRTTDAAGNRGTFSRAAIIRR
ncbi:PQQ-dependent sugar dehydrogenase [Candidatus Solirubrobacter pratensis]|uniref:PQQ-dependent sugar dehydrogenase n=1 Tax=Candidatus Solirubrobacter pratensis TaxID=1298857 RepID=UPI0004002FF4|nr:PQQ-dependent sugar dehydrogenase [Candidatus Solirubrobacter pratensis]